MKSHPLLHRARSRFRWARGLTAVVRQREREYLKTKHWVEREQSKARKALAQAEIVAGIQKRAGRKIQNQVKKRKVRIDWSKLNGK